ncbi:hypothetical protein ACFE04_028301 [Oxalis oulophora]
MKLKVADPTYKANLSSSVEVDPIPSNFVLKDVMPIMEYNISGERGKVRLQYLYSSVGCDDESIEGGDEVHFEEEDEAHEGGEVSEQGVSLEYFSESNASI